jgi:hypothetical protein
VNTIQERIESTRKIVDAALARRAVLLAQRDIDDALAENPPDAAAASRARTRLVLAQHRVDALPRP